MHRALIRRRPLRPGALTALAILLLAGLPGLARPAFAQPGDGIVKPITAKEINGFAERLGLTPMQRAAIDPIHDAYKADFEEVRRRLIEPFVARQRELNMGGPSVTREAVEEMLDDQRRISTRVAALDARFFDQMAPLLSQDQMMLLPRVRMARERTRAQGSGMMAFAGSPVDLSTMLASSDISLSADEAARVDAIMEPYERRLTRRMVELDEQASSMMLRLVDAMEQAGVLGMSQEEMMQDPAKMQEMMQVVQRAFADAGAGVREEAGELFELNLDTYGRLMRELPPRAAVTFRDAFLPQSGAMGLQVSGAGPSGVWLAAGRIRDLDEPTRETILARLRAAIEGENQLLDPLVAEAGEARANMDPMRMDMNAFQEIQERIQKATGTLRTRRAEAETEAAALLGEDWQTRVAAAEAEDADAAKGVVGMPGGNIGAVAGAAVERADRFSGDQFIPGRISDRALGRMADRIGIDELDRPILDTLHQSYRDAFVKLPALDRARTLMRSRWDGSSEQPEVQRARELNTARRTALSEITALEEGFFSDLEATFGDEGPASEAIERERLARHAERLLGSGQRRSVTARGGGQAGDVDLLELVRTVDMPEADRTAAGVALGDRMQAVIEVAERLYAARLELDAAEAAWREALGSLDQGDPMAFQGVYQETMGAATERLEAARGELAELNRANLESVLSALSADGRRAMQSAWQRAAYPSIYNDPMCVLPHYERALALEELGATEREDLRATLATYRGEWERLSEAMAEQMSSVSVDFSNWQDVDWMKMQELERELSTLGMERSEQNIRAANRLRLLLREDQLARLGGLPDPEDERIPTMWGF